MLVPTRGLPMRIHAPDGRFESCPIGGNVHELVDFDEAPVFVSPDDVDATGAAPRRPR
jgi:hypothetical protein